MLLPPPPAAAFYLLHMALDMVPSKEKEGGREKKKKKTSSAVWAEEKPRILSVLKFDSEVQDPGRQKASGAEGEGRQAETD